MLKKNPLSLIWAVSQGKFRFSLQLIL